MSTPPDSPWLVPFDGSFQQASVPTAPPPGTPGSKELKRELKSRVKEFADLQERLYAEDRRSLLLVFQALDAAGKDGTIRAVTSGVNPAGFQVSSFKAPSDEELDHDFLWRTTRRLPERGRIGVFNRSYYEEVLVVRVHPEYLAGQRLPPHDDLDALWEQRFRAIREHERHLAENGTTILKFWLKHSWEEQGRRFLRRVEDPKRNWKFSAGDLAERAHWEAYMDAYEASLAQTSRPWAPWLAIPADDKPYARLCVADAIVSTLKAMAPAFPVLPERELAELESARVQLTDELGDAVAR